MSAGALPKQHASAGKDSQANIEMPRFFVGSGPTTVPVHAGDGATCTTWRDMLISADTAPVTIRVPDRGSAAPEVICEVVYGQFGATVRFGRGLDADVEEWCRKQDILRYVGRLDTAIYDIYKNVRTIRHRLVVHPEIPGQRKVRFEIHLTGEPLQILKDEKKLYATFFRQVPAERQHLFSFTYRIP